MNIYHYVKKKIFPFTPKFNFHVNYYFCYLKPTFDSNSFVVHVTEKMET